MKNFVAMPLGERVEISVIPAVFPEFARTFGCPGRILWTNPYRTLDAASR